MIQLKYILWCLVCTKCRKFHFVLFSISCHKYWNFVLWTNNGQDLRGLWCLTPFSTIFQLYRGSQFYWVRKPQTWRKSLTNFISWCRIEYTSHKAGFELTTLVVYALIVQVVVNLTTLRSRQRGSPPGLTYTMTTSVHNILHLVSLSVSNNQNAF